MTSAVSTRFFGVRHHGPGCARSLRRAFDEWQPDCVLVEGPPEGDGLLGHLRDEHLVPPVALLVHSQDTPPQAAFYPFARFSPEWQALQWAVQRGVTARFIDLPRAHTMAQDKAAMEAGPEAALDAAPEGTPTPEAEATAAESATPAEPPAPRPPRGDPFDDFARANGHRDGESWWNEWVEERGHDADIFAAIAEAMTEVRGALGPVTEAEDEREAQREAHMRQCLRAARKEGFERIAVVCGAWHVPALQAEVPLKHDTARLKGLPKTKVQATWVPWSYRHLSRDGYGAGVVSPGWYDFLWQHDEDSRAVQGLNVPRAAGWLARVAALLRAHDIDCSSAHVIEAIRLANTLAALRERAAPGLPELDEAVRSVISQGDDGVMQLIGPALHIGDALGQVPTDVPVVPLQRDLEQQQKSLRLKAETAQRTLDLDLRQPNDLARSRLLHRLRLLGLHWGTPSRQGSGKGSFHEVWRLQWEPTFAVTLIEASRWGTTVAAAASACVADQVSRTEDLPTLAELVDQVLLAELGPAVAAVTHALDDRAAVSGDTPQLLRTLPPLAQVFRYGNVRQTDTALVGEVLDRLILRTAINLPLAGAGLDDEAAQALREPLLAAHAAVSQRAAAEQTQAWQHALRSLAAMESVHALLRGLATRLLLDDGVVEAEAAGQALQRQLSRANEPLAAAAWLDGFLNRNALVLLHDARIWGLIDAWLSGLGDAHFQQVLPLVRRSFATFSRSERRSLGEKAAHTGVAPVAAGAAGGVGAADTPVWHVERVARALPLLQQLWAGA